MEEGSVKEVEKSSVKEMEKGSETSCTTTLAETTSRVKCSNVPTLNNSSNEERNWNINLHLEFKTS